MKKETKVREQNSIRPTQKLYTGHGKQMKEFAVAKAGTILTIKLIK